MLTQPQLDQWCPAFSAGVPLLANHHHWLHLYLVYVQVNRPNKLEEFFLFYLSISETTEEV